MTALQATILPVPDVLKRDVACFSVTHYSGGDDVAIHVAPQGVPGIVFQHEDGRSAIAGITTQAGQVSHPPTLFLYGPGTDPSVMHFKGGTYTTTQVILKPHALQTLLGLNAATLTGGYVELSEIATADLNARLIDAQDTQTRVALLSNFLIARLERAQRARTRDNLVEAAVRLIHRQIATVTVKGLLGHLHISERQFERRFSQAVGLTPQAYIRVRRFNEAVRLIKSGRYGRLTDVAYALNFYDQSHLIRDIKALSGLTPTKLSRHPSDALHAQTGYSFT